MCIYFISIDEAGGIRGADERGLRWVAGRRFTRAWLRGVLWRQGLPPYQRGKG